ncbi:MAG: DUF1579 domain-containing protein [Gemmatimonadetes bacterium]|nr:DUF1579 domain-containing protein [Gemmatimonadota bacterium]
MTHMPKPGDGHRRLEALAGTWVGEERMYPSDWDPVGGTAIGRTTSRIAVGGFALVTDYEQERDGAVTFSGHGVFTFDSGKDEYSLFWLDSIGSPPEIFAGGFTGDVLTLAHAGPPMHVRLIWDLSKPGTLQSSMEMSADGVAWKKLFDAVYERS